MLIILRYSEYRNPIKQNMSSGSDAWEERAVFFFFFFKCLVKKSVAQEVSVSRPAADRQAAPCCGSQISLIRFMAKWWKPSWRTTLCQNKALTSPGNNVSEGSSSITFRTQHGRNTHLMFPLFFIKLLNVYLELFQLYKLPWRLKRYIIFNYCFWFVICLCSQ